FLFAETLPAVGLTSARGSIGARGSDGGDAMLGAQIALCVLLLSLAAMFVRTLKNLNGLNAGLDWRNILTVRFDFYNSNFGDAALATLYPQMLDSLRSLPGVRFGKAPKDAAYLVVGEIADVLVDDLRRAPPPMIYLPVAQHFPTRGSLEVRTVNRASNTIASVRAALRAVDRQLPISTITPLDEAYAHTFQTQYLLARLTSAFGILAVVLAAIGGYGVQSFRVVRRTSEFGVRM